MAIAKSNQQAVLKRSERLTQGFKSPIEAFNTAYLVEEILEQAGYDQRGDQFRHPNSESGSFSASVQNRRVHTLSSADPLWTGGGGVGAHDAFSVFTVLYHGGDRTKAIKDACNKWLDGWEEEKEMRNNLAGFEDIARLNNNGDETGLMASSAPRSLLPAPVKKKPFKLTSIGELMKQPPTLKWLIKGYLPPEGLGFLIAAPATGKTFLAIDWFCHIACGIPWWGKSVKQGGVVVIAGEGHFGLRRRLKAWGINKGIDMDDKPIVVSDVAASLTDSDSVKAVMEAIDLSLTQLESVDIIVIDTLHRNLGGGDENSSEDMGVYFTYLDELRAKYGCFVLTVHHTGHGEQGRARGSSSIKAAIDVEYIISKSGEVANVSCQKMKDGEKPKAFDFTLSEVTLPWLDEEGEAETSVVVVVSEAAVSSGKEKKLSAQVMVVFKALCTLTIEAKNKAKDEEVDEWMVDVGIENAAWKEQAYTKLTQDNEGSKQKAFNRGKNALIAAGFVDVKNDHYWIEVLSLSSQTAAILDNVSGQLSTNKIMR